MNHDTISVLSGPDVAQRSTVCRVVRDHGCRTPEATALVWRGEEISYRTLLADVGRVRPQIPAGDRSPVAVRMERGPLLVATLLAVLETGAPYLALPTDWPVQRCRQAMAQAGAQICLVDGREAGSSAMTDGLSDLPGVRSVGLDRDAMPDAGGGVFRAVAAEDGCAVFHTSGSSGTPKAALSPHAGIFRIAFDPALAFDHKTRTLQTASLGWDALSLELWAPLLRGGSCVLYDGAYPSAEDVRAAVQTDGVNTLFVTTALFNAFIDDDPDCFRGLRLLMFGGERLSPRHVARCRRLLPEVRLVHCYGPVEATVYVSTYDVPAAGDGDAEQDVSIGTPVAGTTIYLLDPDHLVTELGQPGQIAVAGDGLALRYLGDHEATRQSFPVLPLGPGGAPVRVYLTGDLGRIENDGTLTFLGRLDRQVKIRGVRVDPIEVERIIEKTDEVSRAVVVPLPLGSANKEHLAAFCLTEPGAMLTEQQIRDDVGQALPQACVPHVVRLLAELPLNATGKVDTRRLVANLEEEPSAAAGSGGGPELVALVQDLLSGLLGRPVRDDEDLFLAGATSLTTIRLSTQLHKASGVRLPAAAIMRGRTPARIAGVLAEAAAQPVASPPE